jgi:hypothetical protein
MEVINRFLLPVWPSFASTLARLMTMGKTVVDGPEHPAMFGFVQLSPLSFEG